jgi:hypothetical protein
MATTFGLFDQPFSYLHPLGGDLEYVRHTGLIRHGNSPVAAERHYKQLGDFAAFKLPS